MYRWLFQFEKKFKLKIRENPEHITHSIHKTKNNRQHSEKKNREKKQQQHTRNFNILHIAQLKNHIRLTINRYSHRNEVKQKAKTNCVYAKKRAKKASHFT